MEKKKLKVYVGFKENMTMEEFKVRCEQVFKQGAKHGACEVSKKVLKEHLSYPHDANALNNIAQICLHAMKENVG